MTSGVRSSRRKRLWERMNDRWRFVPCSGTCSILDRVSLIEDDSEPGNRVQHGRFLHAFAFAFETRVFHSIFAFDDGVRSDDQIVIGDLVAIGGSVADELVLVKKIPVATMIDANFQ